MNMDFVTSLDSAMMTAPLWWLLASQIVLGGFDTFYHHEFTERLAWRDSQHQELKLHALRNVFYIVLFLSFAWLEPFGWWATALLLLMIAEAVLTMVDFVEEDRSRRLPATERVTHGVITINYGAILAVLVPVLWARAGEPSTLLTTNHGWLSLAASVVAVLIGVLGAREYFAARRLARLPHPPAAPLVSALAPKQHLLITGATGFIGTRLVEALVAAGHDVCIVTRNLANAMHLPAPLRIVTSIDQIDRYEIFDAIINLAGEPIANGLWTKAKRQRIVESRRSVTQALVDLIDRLDHQPKVFVSGSAVGWYGLSENQKLTEQDLITETNTCFSQQVCQKWERTAQQLVPSTVRVVMLRTGLVLGRDGGMLAQLLAPYEFGLGGPLGNGEQWMPWIERDDMVRLIAHIVSTPELEGPVNATAPNPVTNNQFARALGRSLRRPAILRAPAWPLRLIAGDMANELLLGGQRVLPAKAQASGFRFRYPQLQPALDTIVGKQPELLPRNPTFKHGFFVD